MCGIAGVLDVGARSSAGELGDLARAMCGELRHRGPDDEGVWVDAGAGVALGHRRLAVIDLSPTGAQPMVSDDGRYVITFNGELYNHRELREELAGAHHRFRGSSDTEVLLASWQRWGAAALERANGMFALALWDRAERQLSLVRDRLGEKPLYHGWCGTHFLFGSELDALLAHPGFAASAEVDRRSLALYLRLSYVPSPHSIYRSSAKLAPGTMLEVRAGGPPGEVRARRYWSMPAASPAASGANGGGAGPVDAREATDRLDRLLRDAVAVRMHADVPLGTFLSGGIDSSTVAALAQDQSSTPLPTFTIAFPGDALDEAGHARAVARHLGSAHTEIPVGASAALEVVPSLAEIYDEPFADPSQVPTAVLARETRRHVTVCLSGDGGDEVFGGYNRYVLGDRLWRHARRVPSPLRRGLGRALLAVPPARWDRWGGVVAALAPGAHRVPQLGDKVHKLARVLPARTPGELHRGLVSQWDHSDRILLAGDGDGSGPACADHHDEWESIVDAAGEAEAGDVVGMMMTIDALTTLPDEMLAKVDRATMAVALEARVPLLDHRVVELAWSLPPGLRMRDGRGKWLLRQVLYRYLPPALVDRSKAGFDPPLAAWLRGPLREWAEQLLDPARLRGEGYLSPEVVARCWSEHLSGRRNWDYRLWAVLMFQSWLERGPRRLGNGLAPAPAG